MNRALGIRIFFILLCVLPLIFLLIWIAVGEASPENIRHPDLRNFYEDQHQTIDWFGLWSIRILFLFLLGMVLRRYLLKVTSVIGSLATGLLLSAATAGYFLTITSYQVAETRLAFHPYLSAAGPSIFPEEVSLWLIPHLLIMSIISGLAPFFEPIEVKQ
jgi:hypothetical protein